MPRVSEYAATFGLQLIKAEDRPDWSVIQSWAGPIWRIKDVFTTRDGRWYHEPGVLGSIPVWAIGDYDRAEFDDRGGSTHLFAASVDNGALLPGAGFWYWSSGLAALVNHQSAGIVQQQAKPSGWANIPIEHGSGYTPPNTGVWSYCKFGKSDVLTHAGLPWSWHISTFCVWEPETTTPPEPPTGGGTDLTALIESVDRINTTLREGLRLP